ncbi:conjugal transfer protein TraD, partial [Escherichia coli]|nr:conjugal transfer protein TraD [Escherichia coli]
LQERQKQLRARRTQQLGELVVATGADSLEAETLAGALLEMVERVTGAPQLKEGWSRKGAGFFRRERRARPNGGSAAAAGVAVEHDSPAPHDGGAPAA